MHRESVLSGLLLVTATAALAGCASASDDAEPAGAEQAVIVHLNGTDFDAMTELEDRLIEAIEDEGVGEYDGNAIGGTEAILYAYGPDADALWDVMRPIIEEADPPAGSYAIKRYGAADDPSAREQRVGL